MQHNWNLTPEEGSSEGSENPYDNPSFFEKYSRMPRSLQGLAGAGEWETLKPLLPPFPGRRCWTWAAAWGGIAPMRRPGGEAGDRRGYFSAHVGSGNPGFIPGRWSHTSRQAFSIRPSPKRALMLFYAP